MMEQRYVFTPYPRWLDMPDPITEHCLCCTDPGPDHGLHKHDRSWTLSRILEAWAISREARAGR